MIEIDVLVLSIILQVLAALLALHLIRVTNRRIAWIFIFIALVFMTARRVASLIRLNSTGAFIPFDLFDGLGLVISGLILVGLIYVRQYLYHTNAVEFSLVESERRYRSLAQNIPNAAVFSFDRDHHFTLAEGPLLQQMGFSKERFEGKTFHATFPEEWAKIFAPMLEAALRGNSTTVEQPYKEQTFSIQFIPIKIGNETITGGMALVLDITEKKKAEKERNSIYELLQHTIDGVAEPVMVIGLDYKIKLMNRTVHETYNHSNDPHPSCFALSHYRDTPCNDLAHPCPLQQVKATLLPMTVTHEHRTANGESRHVEIIASPLFDDHGQLQGIIEAARDITERKLIETELIKLRKAVEASSEVIFMTDRDGLITFVNPEFIHLYGYTAEEVIGKVTPRILKSGMMKQDDYAFLWQILLNKQVFKSEVTNKTKDGKLLIVEASVNPVLDENGDIDGFLAIQQDVTTRKQAEREKNRLLSAVQSSIEGIAITDDQDQYVYVNEAHAEIYGYLQAELIGKTWRSLTPKELIGPIEDSLTQTLHNPQVGYLVTEAPALRKDGAKIFTDVRAKALWGDDGRYSGHICNVVDITQRKQTDEIIHRRAEELEALTQVSRAMRVANSHDEIVSAIFSQLIELFDGKGVALTIFDSDHEYASVKYARGAWDHWIGRRQLIAHGVTGKVFVTGQPYITNDLSVDKLSEWATDAENVPWAVCLPLMANQRMIGVLWLGRYKVFTEKDIKLLSAIADMAASALQRQSLYQDLQEKLKSLQEAQNQIIQAEKLVAIGQLSSGIAHEVNNPLTSILLYAQMMQKRVVDDGARRDLDKIVSESLRASRIVRSLLDFSRQHSPERSPVNINDILKNVIDITSYKIRSNNIQEQLELSQDIPILMADGHQLQQVFLNLVNNAWQAINETKRDGNLWIKTELAQSSYKNHQENNSTVIRIIVEDNGSGIQEEYLTKIFDPFFTTKPEGSGTGLGLSICHGIISEHGGNIWVESEIGKGSKFIVELPVVSPDQINIDKDYKDFIETTRIENSHILIIDDEQNVQEVLTRALKSKGYSVESVSNAEDGLYKMAQVDYSTILCDIRMPGISGLDFYREVQIRNPEMVKRIVFITGDSLKIETQMLIKDKNVLCLTKPFELDKLYKMIQFIENNLADKIY